MSEIFSASAIWHLLLDVYTLYKVLSVSSEELDILCCLTCTVIEEYEIHKWISHHWIFQLTNWTAVKDLNYQWSSFFHNFLEYGNRVSSSFASATVWSLLVYSAFPFLSPFLLIFSVEFFNRMLFFGALFYSLPKYPWSEVEWAK